MATRDARKLGSQAQLELRRRAVTLRRKGHRHREIADLLEVSESAVRKWWSLYRHGGGRALSLGRRGRPKGACRTLTPEQERQVKRMIIDKTPEQLKMPFALWTRQAVRELMDRTHGVQMPIRSVGNYLLRWGFTPQRTCWSKRRGPISARSWGAC